jgi:hypothetical protein
MSEWERRLVGILALLLLVAWWAGKSNQKSEEGTTANTTAAPQSSEASPHQSIPAGDAKPASTGPLKPAFSVKIRKRTPACLDIRTALNTPMAERIAAAEERYWQTPREARPKARPTCSFVGGPNTKPGGQREFPSWFTYEVPGTVVPPLPPGKVAHCVTGQFIIGGTPSVCSWVITKSDDVCKIGFTKTDSNEACWARW